MVNWIGFIRSALKNVYASQDNSSFVPLLPLVEDLNELFSIVWKYENEGLTLFLGLLSIGILIMGTLPHCRIRMQKRP